MYRKNWSVRFAMAVMASAFVFGYATADEPGTIRGTVRDPGGRPVEGAEITVIGADRSAVTDSGGIFAIDALEPGKHRLRVVADRFAVIFVEAEVESGGATTMEIGLDPVVMVESVSVSPRYSLLNGDTASGSSMSREEIDDLPHFGDDLYRAIATLPAVTNQDISAQFNVRGGLPRENMVELDGLEIYEPFHLQDFEGVFSIFDPRVIGGADLFTGAFPAEYGDRMSGVLDMTILNPTGLSHNVGLSVSTTWYTGTGLFAEGKGSWVASVRRGYLDLILSLAGEEEENEEMSPRYMDVFGKIAYRPTPNQTVSFDVLFSDDYLKFSESEEGEEIDSTASYGNWYVWGTHLAVPTPRTTARTILGLGHVDRDRTATGDDQGDVYEIRDVRDMDILTLKHDWNYRHSDTHSLKFGVEARRYDAVYDYLGTLELDRAIPDPRFRPPQGEYDYQNKFTEEYYSIHASDRIRLTERLTTEIGLRYEDVTLTEESHLSPRINLAWTLGDDSRINLGWGQVFQSHRPNELDVQDGETSFHDAERSNQTVVGYEKRFDGGWTVRAEAYHSKISDPRPHYENLFNSAFHFPEMSYDRIQVAPESAVSRGFELFVRAPRGRRYNGWGSYVYSSVEDRVDGRDQPRQMNQPHALTLNLHYNPSPKWNINAVFRYHTGWPATPVSAVAVENPDGSTSIVPVVGEFYSEELPSYHRLDVRGSYTRPLRRGSLEFFVDIANLYNQKNVRGLEINDSAFTLQDDGSVLVHPEEEEWLGLMPSFGVSWQF